MSAEDLRLCAKRISMDLHEPDTGEMATQIRLAIIDAIKLLQDTHLPFNHRTFDFTTVEGQSRYGPETLPADFIRPLDSELVCFQNSDLAQGYNLKKLGRNEARNLLTSAQASNSQPTHWAWEGDAILILPPPDATVNIVRVHHRFKVAGPAVSYDGTTFTFGNAEIASPWFGDAERVVRLRAEHLLCRDYLLDAERAARYMTGFLEELTELQGDTVSEMGAEIPGDL